MYIFMNVHDNKILSFSAECAVLIYMSLWTWGSNVCWATKAECCASKWYPTWMNLRLEKTMTQSSTPSHRQWELSIMALIQDWIFASPVKVQSEPSICWHSLCFYRNECQVYIFNVIEAWSFIDRCACIINIFIGSRKRKCEEDIAVKLCDNNTHTYTRAHTQTRESTA